MSMANRGTGQAGDREIDEEVQELTADPTGAVAWSELLGVGRN